VGYVVVGLTDDCAEHPGHDCVSWVHGPFGTRREAREHAGEVPAGFRPHILPLKDDVG
jgi:hypothetical protein